MLFNVCSSCEQAKWLYCFRVRVRAGIESYRSQCKECESKAQVARNRKKYSTDEGYRQKSLERLSSWGKKNKSKRLLAERQRKRSKYSGDANYRGMVKSQAAEYRARRLRATPLWLTEKDKEEIARIYLTCPEGFDVDHVLPLKGKNVCGLHVPWNLQHLPQTENRSKGNALIYSGP